MIASVRCADGAHAVIGDRVWISDTEHGELIGIVESLALVRITGDCMPRVIDAGELRKGRLQPCNA
jgi:hypothetical protein